jgi:murein DD-endopeptidase MepM/ murein hydrolase activator NlpD
LKVDLRYHPGTKIPLRWPVAALVLLVGVWGLMTLAPPEPVPSPYAAWIGPIQPVPELPDPWPRSVSLDADRVVEDRFSPGSNLASELRSHGVGGQVAHNLATVASDSIDLRKIRAGQGYRLYFDAGGELSAVRYQIDRQTAWFFTLEDAGWTASKVVIPVRLVPRFISASINGSLEAALSDQVPDRRSMYDLILKVADLYGWDVDFNYDLQPGDRLDLVVEERYVEDEFAGYGEVLAAEFRVGSRMLPVIRFMEDETSSYYSPDGQSLRRAFLRSPVKYQRISSSFSPRRVHPVTGVARAHRGVDYVASPGTPVQSTADGVVIEAGYGSEPGRYVKIRHGGSYSSVYMHLSRIAEGVRTGVEVRQGQLLGYVGKTGNATGYHLHYGLMQGGRYVDPVRLQMPAADPVRPEVWSGFVEQRDRWLGLLRQGQVGLDVRIAGAAGGM